MAMKESGIEWVGLIPDDWKIAKNNRLFNISKQLVNENWKNTQLLSLTKSGIIEKNINDGGGKQPESFGTYQYVEKDDIVLCLFDIDVSAVFSDRSKYDGMISPAYRVMKCTDAILPVYAKWWFDAVNIGRYYLIYTKSLRKTIDADGFGNILTVVPPLSEQQSIADYLDETCSKIDEIIAEAKASIDEYEKLKQATIDENILGYDSVHIKLRQLGSLKNGLNFSHSDDVANIKFLGVGCFKDNMILSEVDDFADEHIDFEISEEYLLSNGDIVFVRSNGSKELVGRSIMVENIDYPVTFSGFCIRFRNMHTELVDNRFLLYYFRTTHFKQSLLKYSNDSTNINNLNQKMLNAIRINAPVIAEQKLLVKKMEDQIFVFDSLITEKESLINDLEAYKKSLIYEVVTGKRRVV